MNEGIRLMAKMVRQFVRELGNTFERPDEDWPPMLFALGKDGLQLFDFSEAGLGTVADKEQLAAVMTPLLAEAQALVAAFATSSWSVSGEAARTVEGGSLAGHPERQEMVAIQVVDVASAGL